MGRRTRCLTIAALPRPLGVSSGGRRVQCCQLASHKASKQRRRMRFSTVVALSARFVRGFTLPNRQAPSRPKSSSKRCACRSAISTAFRASSRPRSEGCCANLATVLVGARILPCMVCFDDRGGLELVGELFEPDDAEDPGMCQGVANGAEVLKELVLACPPPKTLAMRRVAEKAQLVR